jgi:biopolymer transport protein ExbB
MNEFWDFLKDGGPLMVPIVALSVVALAVFIERAWALRSSQVVPRDFLHLIHKKVKDGRAAEALTLCEGNPSAISRVVASGLKQVGRPREVIKEALEEVGRLEVNHMARFVEVLGTVAAVSPLLGLLGTVVGMIEVFQVVVAEAGEAGPVNPASLASGISVALITTVGGLCGAIPAFLGYKFLLGRLDTLAMEMEEASLSLLYLVAEAPASEPSA